MFPYHQVDTLSQMKRDTSSSLVSNYVWTDLVPSTIISIRDSQKSQILRKSLRNKLHMGQGANMSMSA